MRSGTEGGAATNKSLRRLFHTRRDRAPLPPERNSADEAPSQTLATRGEYLRFELPGPRRSDEETPESIVIDLYIPRRARVGNRCPWTLVLPPRWVGPEGPRSHGQFLQHLARSSEALISMAITGDMALVVPHGSSEWGGSLYTATSSLGDWPLWIEHSLRPAIEARFPVGGSRARRGLLGFNEGALGCFHLALDYPHSWSVAACHSLELNFAALHRPRIALAAQPSHPANSNPSGGDRQLYELLARVAYFEDSSARAPAGATDLPWDYAQQCVDDTRFSRWLVHDPMIRARTLADHRGPTCPLLLEVGQFDPPAIAWGHRRLAASLVRANYPHRFAQRPGSTGCGPDSPRRSLTELFAAISG